MTLLEGSELSVIQRWFKLGGQAIRGATDLDLGNVSQTLPIVPEVLRRSMTESNLTGWSQGTLQNVHTAADDEVSGIDPYAPGTSAVAPFPALVPNGWDVWLMGVSAVIASGAATITGARVSVNPGDFQQSWGQDDAGAPFVGDQRWTVAYFNTVQDDVTGPGLVPALLTPGGLPFVALKMRIPRGANLAFHTESLGTSTYQALLLMGLFPAGLGQDILG
jgi:hypothetical protein